jgi:hypothetical protein
MLVVASPVLAEQEETFSHKGQFTVNLQAGLGYRGIFPYDEEYCGDLASDGGNKSNCLGASPFAIDVALGFGVFDKLELFLEMRIGLAKDFGPSPNAEGPRVFAIAPGLKGYIAEVGATRFFATLQLPLDFTDYQNPEGSDIGIKNINGFQLDLHNTLGIYGYFGEIVSWKRWLRFEVEGGLGVQARFP